MFLGIQDFKGCFRDSYTIVPGYLYPRNPRKDS